MSSYKELKEEFKKKLEELRKDCEHEDSNNWRKFSWKKYNKSVVLYKDQNQVLEIKTCKICESIVNIRTKCLECRKDIERKDWFSIKVKEKGGRFFRDMEIIGLAFFCNKECFQEYKKLRHRISKEIEIIETIEV